jgi:hypothetical protein
LRTLRLRCSGVLGLVRFFTPKAIFLSGTLPLSVLLLNASPDLGEFVMSPSLERGNMRRLAQYCTDN